MTLTALACGILTLALFWWIFTAPPAAAAASARDLERQALGERSQAIRINLADLEFEHRAGKLNDADFARSRAMLERESGRVARALAKLS